MEMTNERHQEIWKLRNQIIDLLKEHKCHIELGHTFAFDVFFLCANEEHDIKYDADIQDAR